MGILAAFFIIAKTWKQSRCLLVDEWITKLWYIQTKECYSALKRKELLHCEKTWGKLKHVALGERNQSDYISYKSSDMTFWKGENYGQWNYRKLLRSVLTKDMRRKS